MAIKTETKPAEKTGARACVYVPKTLHKSIKRMALEQDVTTTVLVTDLLSEAIKRKPIPAHPSSSVASQSS